MSELPFVSIIIPCFNDPAALSGLVDALSAQDYPHDRFECLIIDNGSSPPLKLSAVTDLNVILLREERIGSYAARNRGAAAARGSIFAFTDADCIPHGDWISNAVSAISAAGDNAMLGGKVEVFTTNVVPASAVEWCSFLNDLDQGLYINKWHFAATANLVTTRKAFARVGLFDASLCSGGDREWGRRAWKLGISQHYVESVIVRHPVRVSWRQLIARRRRITGGQFIINQRAGRYTLLTAMLIVRLGGEFARKAWYHPSIPSWRIRVKVIGVDLVLRMTQLTELARLFLGGRPSRQ